MTSFLDPLIAFVSAHAWLAYLALFLAALLEAVPVVGALVPGSTIILALSALVPGGELQLWGVLAAAIAGALLGDGSAYWAGHRAQEPPGQSDLTFAGVLRISPDRGTLTLRFRDPLTGPFNMPLTVRATVLEGRQPVIGETKVEIVPER